MNGLGREAIGPSRGPATSEGCFGKVASQPLGVPPSPYSHPHQGSPGGPWGPLLTSCVTRLPAGIGGGVGTEEPFACQARELALNTWLASLRSAEEDGQLLTRLVPQDPTPTPPENCCIVGMWTPNSWLQTCAPSPLSVPAPSSLGSQVWAGISETQPGGSGGLDGRKWSSGSPLSAEQREEALVLVRGLGARHLDVL